MYERLYLSNLTEDQIFEYTGLAIDELEALVGRFTPQSQWAGKLRGELRLYSDGSVTIFNNFKNKLNNRKVVWSNNEINFN